MNKRSIADKIFIVAAIMTIIVGLIAIYQFVIPRIPPLSQPTKTPILTGTPPTSSVTDDWSLGSIDTSKWHNWGSPQTSVVNKQLKITSTLTTEYYGLDSGAGGATQDLTGSYVTNELITAGNQSLSTWEVHPIMILEAGSATNRILFFVIHHFVIARVHIGAVNKDIRRAAYNSATDKYFRVQENSGTIYFDTSVDGRVWTTFTSTTDPFDITHVVVGMEAGTWKPEPSTTSAIFDNFNIVPST